MPTTSKPTVTGTNHVLPFEKLSPTDFERLVVWLVRCEGFQNIEHLGATGNEQGRDVVAVKDGRKWAFQCKRVGSFSFADAKVEIEKVHGVAASDRPDVLAFLVTTTVSAKTRKKAAEIAGPEIECVFWAQTELDEKVKAHPRIVNEFFRNERSSPVKRLLVAVIVLVSLMIVATMLIPELWKHATTERALGQLDRELHDRSRKSMDEINAAAEDSRFDGGEVHGFKAPTYSNLQYFVENAVSVRDFSRALASGRELKDLADDEVPTQMERMRGINPVKNLFKSLPSGLKETLVEGIEDKDLSSFLDLFEY